MSSKLHVGMVEARDYALWPSHIHGDDKLKEKLLKLDAGDLVELEVNGHRGMWKKMDDGKDGRPTPGLKGIGSAQREWHSLKDRWGDLVSIKEVR